VSSSAQRPRRSRRRSCGDLRSRSRRRPRRQRQHPPARPHRAPTVSDRTAGQPGPRRRGRPRRRPRRPRLPWRRLSPGTACRPARPRLLRPPGPRLRPLRPRLRRRRRLRPPSQVALRCRPRPPGQVARRLRLPLRLPRCRPLRRRVPRRHRPGRCRLCPAGLPRLRRAAAAPAGLARRRHGVAPRGRVSVTVTEGLGLAARPSPVHPGLRRGGCRGRDRGRGTTRSARPRAAWARGRTRARPGPLRPARLVPLVPVSRAGGQTGQPVAPGRVARAPAGRARLTCRGLVARGPAR
jgi:hypothetical protein